MSRRGDSWRCVLPMAASWLLAGCASQGPLRSPSLNLPAPVRHVEARRVGSAVELSWTNPSKTSDGTSLTARHGAGTLQAQLCRREAAITNTCKAFATLPVTSGTTSTFHDALPSNLASGPVRELYYGIRVVNAQGKGAAWTGVLTAAGMAPQPLSKLEAHPVASGILLRWSAGDGGVMLRVTRGADTAHATLLRVDPQPGAPDRGLDGTVDAGGHAGQEQRYVGFRKKTVEMGGQPVVLESDSAGVTVSASATVPLPAPPVGFEAVANTLGAPEVDLVWQPPDDASVTGYRVYRQQDEGPSTLLTKDPTTGFTFTDKTALPGHRYAYRVSAVNPTGESEGVAATATLP